MELHELTFGLGGKTMSLVAIALLALPAANASAQAAGQEKRPRAISAGSQVILGGARSDGPSNSFLGVHVREIDGERAREKGLSEERGVEITKIVDDSAAAKAGIECGDVVLEYNSEPVDGVAEFIRLVRETPVGRQVRLKIVHSKEERNVAVTIGEKPRWTTHKQDGPAIEFSGSEVPRFAMPDVPHVFTMWGSARLGIVGESLDSQLAEYFGVKEGVLVRSVSADTPAARAGLRAGDVITKVNDTAVATAREVTSAIQEREGDTVELTVMRDRQQIRVKVTLEVRSGGRGRVLPNTLFGATAITGM